MMTVLPVSDASIRRSPFHAVDKKGRTPRPTTFFSDSRLLTSSPPLPSNAGRVTRRWSGVNDSGGWSLSPDVSSTGDARESSVTVASIGYSMVICGHHADDARRQFQRRLEKVKFGVPIASAFTHDIPATLLVLLLKVNKEGPLKKDIWRAPGNQAQVRKLAHVMQHGRLVNIANFSVYTAASVIKKFLAKLPGGIFGLENEERLFATVGLNNVEEQRLVFYRVVCTLPTPSQHLLVLLLGTFRTIADEAELWNTRMSAEAIGVSVAPSLFHTCIHDGQRATVEDVKRFKAASEIVTKMINSFGHTNLFPRECYEFYARITGRTLHVDENWLFTFQYPSRTFSQPEVSTRSRADDRRLSGEIDESPGPSSHMRVSHSLHHRFSSSLAEVLMHSDAEEVDEEGEDGDEKSHLIRHDRDQRAIESTRSLSYLEWVHERQTRRMRTRSEWFLSPVSTMLIPTKTCGTSRSIEFEMCVPGGFDPFASHIPFSPLQQATIGVRPPPPTATVLPAPPPPATTRTTVVGGVVRKRSWRTHYVRPNHSLDQDESDRQSENGQSSKPSSTLRRSAASSLGNLPRRSGVSLELVGLLSHEAMPDPP